MEELQSKLTEKLRTMQEQGRDAAHAQVSKYSDHNSQGNAYGITSTEHAPRADRTPDREVNCQYFKGERDSHKKQFKRQCSDGWNDQDNSYRAKKNKNYQQGHPNRNADSNSQYQAKNNKLSNMS